MMIHHKEVTRFPYLSKDLEINRNKRTSDCICTFDVEATTFFIYIKDNKSYSFNQAVALKGKRNISDANWINDYFIKHAYSYIWQFSINDDVYYGRFLSEVKPFIMKFCKQYDIQIKVFVHNLSYEFQFIKNYFKWNNKPFSFENKSGLVARRMHKVQSITTKDNYINFIDTLIISGCSLERLTDKFGLSISKKAGDLDYDKIRHSKTVLTDEELAYCEYDCRVLYEYVKYEKKIAKHISSMPRTQTGKTRKLVKAEYNKKSYGHKNRREETARTAPNLSQYLRLHKAFLGGYTHANYIQAGKIKTNVVSKDLKSWYPGCMVLEKFPTGAWQDMPIDKGTLKYIEQYFESYAFCITVKFTNVESLGFNHYLSISKCDKDGAVKVDNGRIISADEIVTTITEQDYLIICENYMYTDVQLIDCMYCEKQYIDKEILDVIIHLFSEKERIGKALRTSPDDIALIVQYKGIKELINSLYGMSVTNYISDIIELLDDNTWTCTIIEYEEIARQLQELQENKTLTTPYSWGVWITAYARRGLWQMIKKINADVVYCDTDSIKYINPVRWKYAFNKFNKSQHEKLIEMGLERDVDIRALNKIGTFEDDGKYQEFITLGAKKYCYKDKDGLHITVSGVSKKGAVCLDNDINNFKSGFCFDYRANGKQVVYVDESLTTTLIDDAGVSQQVKCASGICIYPAVKKMNVGYEYAALLRCSNDIIYDDDLLDFVADTGCLLLKTL